MGYPGNSKATYPGSNYQSSLPPPQPSSLPPRSDYPLPPPDPYAYQHPAAPGPASGPAPGSYMPMPTPGPMYPEVGPNPPTFQPESTPFPAPMHTHVEYVPYTSEGSRASNTGSSSSNSPYAIEIVNGVPRIKGRKKALLVGINYPGSQAPLRGCIKDVQNMKSFLIQRYGFQDTPQTMVVLTDDQQQQPHFLPTKKNMITAMQWLVAGASAGDSLFFHFSGHGDQKADQDGDEEDGFDETILPMDFKSAGMIVDDEIHALLVKPLPPGVRLTAVFDSCHSGTAMDLPYVYLPSGEMKKRKTKQEQLLADAGRIGVQLLQGNKMGALKSFMNFLSPKKAVNVKQVEHAKQALADVVQFAGCKDSQTSADASIGGEYAGAMSWALLKSIESQPSQSYAQILTSTRGLLAQKYSQTPQLSSGRQVDMNQLFAL